MIFTQLRFIALFAACWVCFVALPRQWRMAILTFWGLVFYWTYAGTFVGVLLLLSVAARFAHRRAIAWSVAVTIVGLLTYFKMGTASDIVSVAGSTSSGALLIPLGFSYVSFELLHIIIERRRGRLEDLSLLSLLAFVFLFPTRVAGPIKRYPQFVKSVAEAELTSDNVYAGLLRVLTGLAKKFVLADVLALMVDQGGATDWLHAWGIVFAYAFQIYFDFSAYSDLAIGFSRMLGIVVPENFAWPYLATDIREFWNRWHMSLSFWVRDYVFLPVGRALFGTRLRSRPVAIAVISYLITFAVVGAWHGLTAAFVTWGVYHGVLLAAHHVIRAKLPAVIADHPFYHSRASAALSQMITFLCVAIGWLPFMTDLPNAVRLLTIMFGA